MNKKAQGEIITTVLIILLVLAAVVIVWQAVKATTNKASTKVESGAQCIGLDLAITAKCDDAGNLNITVVRGGDSVGTAALKVTTASGATSGSNEVKFATFKALDVAQFTQADFTGLTVGETVTIGTGLILEDKTACAGSTATVTCA